MTINLQRGADNSLDLGASVIADINAYEVLNLIWRRAFAEWDEESNEEFANADKELGSEFSSEVVEILTEAGLCPPLPILDVQGFPE